MFSKTCEYGIRATIFIAAESIKDKKIGQKEIAEEIDSPLAFTAKILQNLVRKKIVNSTKGAGGGFYIEPHRIKQIKFIEIVQALDCDSIITGCGLGLKDCSEEHPCPVHNQFKHIKASLIEMLNNTTLEDLASGIKEGNTFLKY